MSFLVNRREWLRSSLALTAARLAAGGLAAPALKAATAKVNGAIAAALKTAGYPARSDPAARSEGGRPGRAMVMIGP